MKGVTKSIQVYLYVIIGLFVLVSMIIIVSKYSRVFFGEDEEVGLGNDKAENSKTLVSIIEKCWDNHRKGLDPKSGVCKKITFETNVGLTEKEINPLLNCEVLPNSDCYPDDCSDCSSPHFNDTDKIMWFAEPENTELKINYFGGSREIVVVGSPCDDLCMCRRDCKQSCIEQLARCEGCFERCEE